MTQSEYEKKLAHAQRMIDQRLTSMKRTLTSLTLWQRRANYYAKQAAITDEDRAALRARQRATIEARRAQRRERRIIT